MLMLLLLPVSPIVEALSKLHQLLGRTPVIRQGNSGEGIKSLNQGRQNIRQRHQNLAIGRWGRDFRSPFKRQFTRDVV